MKQNIFESLGFTSNEGKIYETLIELGESSISDIATATKIHRRNVYDAVQRLINDGLIFQIFSVNGNKYNAVDPDKLSELVREKQEQLDAALPNLKKKFSERASEEEAYIYRGYEGQKNIWRDILRVGKEVMNIGAKGQWFDPKLEASRNAFFREANRKGIMFHLLFDYEVKTEIPELPKTYPGKSKYRFLPKDYSTDSIINIFGDYVVTYTGVGIKKMDEDSTFFIIHSKNLAESYRKWFWYMWEQSKEDRKITK